MRTVLIVGDSLTAGTIGSPYTGFLGERLPGARLIVRGKNNDTLLGAAGRAERILAARPVDVLVLMIGVNDILLPFLSGQRGLWAAGIRLIHKLGSATVSEPLAFRDGYAAVLARLRRRHSGPIVVATLTCLGEDLASELNRQRAAFNAEIRALAGRAQVLLADLAEAFDDVLAQLPYRPNRQLLRYDVLFWNAVRARLGLPAGWRESDPYQLTVDGVHFNPRGARLVAKTIAAQVEAALSAGARVAVQ